MNAETRSLIDAARLPGVCLSCRQAEPTEEVEVRVVQHPSAGSVHARETIPYAEIPLVVPLCDACAPRYRPRPYPRVRLVGLFLLCVASAFTIPYAEERLPSLVAALIEVLPWVLCFTLICSWWVLQERRAERAYALHPAHARLEAAGYSSKHVLADPARGSGASRPPLSSSRRPGSARSTG